MSITDELRKRIDDEALLLSTRRELWNIADRIDAEHEKAVTYIRSFCDRLQEAAESREDVTLWGVDYVALPVDAEGEPWHIGDEIDNQHNQHLTVSEIAYESNGCWMLHAKPNWRFYADLACHYHPPTVEDVLMEFHERMDELGTTDQCVGSDRADAVDALLRERAELVAEYAAKLRLAGEGV